MSMLNWALIVMGGFIAVWFLFVAPAEKRHHERKLAILQKKIDARQGQDDPVDNDPSKSQDDEFKES
jgi:hypothetical protein